MKSLLGAEYNDFRESYYREPASGLRVNRLKLDAEGFQAIAPLPIKPIPWIDNGFYWKTSEGMPTKHPYYYAGLYYIQEPSAMTPANLLPVAPGDKVLDLCAAPGGKSTELAAKLNGTGLLVSNDISYSRARALVKNLSLFGVRNAVILSEEPKDLLSVFEGYFDKILVDAPCSGEGMFRKEPAVMKNWEQYGVGYYNKLQKEILRFAVKMLKPGGMLLYSTCTFSPEENEGSVQYLLSEFPEFSVSEPDLRYLGFDRGHPEWIEGGSSELRKCVRIWPHRMEGEGHFCALLKKAESGGQEDRHTGKSKSAAAARCRLEPEEREFLTEIGFNTDADIRLIGDKLFLLPEGLPELPGMRILRSGLYIGDRKKNRFEPSQPLAMALRGNEVPDFLSFSSDNPKTIKYLKCDTLELTQEEQCSIAADKMAECLTLVGVSGFPLGWGKRIGDRLKNKYFSGWRWM